MSANRWAIHLLLLAGLPTLPACLVSTGSGSSAETTPPSQSASITTLPRPLFADLRPGENRPLHEPTTGVLTSTIPPPDLPLPGESPAVVVTAPTPLPETVTASKPTAPADPMLVAVVRAFLDNRPDLAKKRLEELDGPNQELLLRLVPALVSATRVDLGTPNTEVGDLVRQVEAALAVLSARAPLAIEKACFCRWLLNFARYEPLPERPAFAPGTWAALYVEMRNVPSVPASRPTEGEGYLTRLVCTLQVHDAAGAVVPVPDQANKLVPTLTDDKRDFTRSPVRDYFLLFRFRTPLKPGAYTVHFQVQDPASGRPGSGRAVSRIMSFRVQ
ncbi:MAG TPA: hypothetical protein VFG68_09175 [Fimbriiglobus sp.]|nr:hypothetical protein [Fimbriiglobus sp.]